MPYTLTMGLVWVLLAVVLGIVLGWLLRSVAARRQVERVRAEANDESEIARLRTRVAGLDSVVNERDRLRLELDAALAAGGGPVAAPTAATAGATGGKRAGAGPGSASDDLTAVVGIDGDVAELCRAIGIDTWAELSVTEVSLLRTMLTDAGRSPADPDPSSWPEQARLLAAGSWSEFELRFRRSASPQTDG